MSVTEHKTQKAKIEYQCNNCLKSRLGLLPQALDLKVDSRGLAEYTDLHLCKDKQLKAILLYVDPQYNVRSQVPIDLDGKNEQKEEAFFIPMPKKVKLATKNIALDYRFKGKLIKEICFKDLLRQSSFLAHSSKKLEDNIVKAQSNLKFIELQANLAKKVDKSCAEGWFHRVVNNLEQIVHLDERIFSYILLYLDTIVNNKPEDKLLSSLDFLMFLPISVPISTETSLIDFKENWSSMFSNLTIADYRDYMDILQLCLNNEQKTTLDIFEQMQGNLSLKNFLSAIDDLSSNAILSVETLQFITTHDPAQ